MKYLMMLSLVLLAACGDKGLAGNAAGDRGNQDLRQLFDRYWEERMRLYPIEATQNGDNRYNDRLHIDISEPFRDTLRLFYGRYLDGIRKFDREALEENDRISYDIFRREMEMQLEGLRYNEHFIPFQQFWGLPLTMGQLGSGESAQPFRTAEDYRNWMSRATVFSAWADTAIAAFRRGAAAGLTLPRPLVLKMIPQMRDMANPDTAKSVFFGPLRSMPNEVMGNDSLKRAFTATMTTYVLPAYKRLGDFLQNEYLPKARTTTGIAATPGGAERYNYLIRYWTTTDKSAEEIYQTGLAEVKRIRGEMERVKNEVGFRGDLDAFFNQMRNDPGLMPFRTAEEVLDSFRAIRQKIDPHLDKMFGRRPKTPFEIKQTEAFRAASASAEYQQGTPDGSRPGIFYIPILEPTRFNITSGMESLFLHEAIPGHHYQISLQQENEALPRFRRFAWYGAYGEGWALYTESLGRELGLYTNPYQYMGALGDEIHRAIRLVVDVGMHTRSMTREEAIKYMMDNEAISEEGAVAEIERYMAIPGQALSYKIGALKIRELRNKYTQQLGNEFRLSEFHDEFLKDGGMPLEVVERKMNAWAAAKGKRA